MTGAATSTKARTWGALVTEKWLPQSNQLSELLLTGNDLEEAFTNVFLKMPSAKATDQCSMLSQQQNNSRCSVLWEFQSKFKTTTTFTYLKIALVPSETSHVSAHRKTPQ